MEWNNETDLLDLDPQWMNADPQFIQRILSSEEEITSSDNSPPPYFNPSSPSSTRLILLHKPRGSKGVWQEVDEGMKLRVSKPNGKKLKLQYLPDFEYDKNSPRLELLESQDETNTFLVSKAKFEIELVKTLERSIDIEVKLFQPSKRLMFRLTVITVDGSQTFVAKSVEFSTQSSGGHLRESIFPSVENLVQVISPEKKRVREDEEQPQLSERTTVIPGSLHVKGVVRAQAFMQFSDIRLKTNIEEIVDALQIITQLQGKSYQWKADVDDSGTGGKRVIGLIAQEVQRVLPEVVREDPETGILSVSYAEILPILIEAFKEFVSNYQDNQRDIRSELFQLQNQLDAFSRQLSEARATEQEKQRMILNLARTSRILFRPNAHPRPPLPTSMHNNAFLPSRYRPAPPLPYYRKGNQIPSYDQPPYPQQTLPFEQSYTPHNPIFVAINQPNTLVSYPPTPTPNTIVSQPISQVKKFEAGMDPEKVSSLWFAGGRLQALMQGALFLVFIASLICLVLGIYYLVEEANAPQQDVTTPPPTNYGLDDERSSTSNRMNTVATATTSPQNKAAVVSMKGMSLTVIGIVGIISSFVGFLCILSHRRNLARQEGR